MYFYSKPALKFTPVYKDHLLVKPEFTGPHGWSFHVMEHPLYKDHLCKDHILLVPSRVVFTSFTALYRHVWCGRDTTVLFC